MNKDFNWTQFFKDAGLPLSIAKRYSALFDDNRISKDMLMDLNKEILVSMGITAMGDVINIMKQAKKTYSLDVKRRDAVSPASKTVSTSNKRPPPPTAHSTTAGQAPAVSTTSASTKKKIVAKRPKTEVPDSPQEVAYVGYIIDSSKEGVVLEPKHSIRSTQLYSAEEEVQPEADYYVESTVLQEDALEEDSGAESYQTHGYEASKLKRPMTMYSDNPSLELPEPKQPRVIILPGDRQDIFTTSGLQKAAKVYESGEEEDLTTDRSRRLLESAGLIPSKEKSSAGNSVFSRLDYKPAVTTHVTPASSSSTHHPPPEVPPTMRGRIINLTKTSARSSEPPTNSDLPRTVISTSPTVRKISTFAPPRKRAKPPSPITSLPSKVLVKRLVSSREDAKPVARKLGDRIRSSQRESIRDPRSLTASTFSRSQVRFAKNPESRNSRSGVFGYEGGGSRTESKRAVVSPASLAKVKLRSSMVADEYEYQARRQHDIRSRLEVRELQKAARRGGPLSGRLGSHKVFRRLE